MRAKGEEVDSYANEQRVEGEAAMPKAQKL